jgi:uncharacterized OsmC-like protein
MSEVAAQFTIRVEQVRGYEFETCFDKEHYAPLKMDEPAPLGRDTAPNPARILAAAIGNCLSASLVFCAKRAGLSLEKVNAEVDVEVVRNENKRLRIGKIDVRLRPNAPDDHPAMAGCIQAFEDFCIVTESVRSGIEVNVKVES